MKLAADSLADGSSAERRAHEPAGGSPIPAAVVVAVAGCWLTALVLVTLYGLARPLPWLNHDVAFHALIGREMLDGSRLYLDLHDTNPPGSQFLHGAVVGLARALGAPVVLALTLIPLACAAAGFALLAAARLRPAAATPGPEGGTILATLVALAYVLLLVPGNFGNNVIPGAHGVPYDWGEREQLFALLFVPYLVWRLVGTRRPRWLFAYLVALGALAMFKPYWPPMLVAVEAWAWSRRDGRGERAVPLALAAGLALPPLALLAHSPSSFRAFFGEVLPWHLRGAYAPYAMGFDEFVRTPFHGRLVAGAAAFGAMTIVAWRRRALGRDALLLLVGLAAFGYASLVHQHKFWSYHAIVFFAVVVCGTALLLGATLTTLDRASLRFALWAAALVGLLVGAGAGLAGLRTLVASHVAFGHALVPLVDGRRSVMFFSMSVDHSYAALRTGTPTVGPWTVHFMLPALLAGDPAGRGATLDGYVAEVARRIESARPELLIFTPSRQALPPKTTLHDLLGAHGLLPRPGYERVPPARLAAISPGLASYVVYEARSGAGR